MIAESALSREGEAPDEEDDAEAEGALALELFRDMVEGKKQRLYDLGSTICVQR